MNRAQAYELAKARGFNKSISAFGGQFTKNPEAIVCGIKRIDKGVFIEVQEDSSATVSINSDRHSTTVDSQPETLPLNEENSVVEDSSTKVTQAEITANHLLQDISSDTQQEEKKSDSVERVPRQQSDRPPRMRRKLYTANGTHQAICRFQGVLMPKPEGEKGFRLLLPGLEVEAHFAFPKTLWYYRQNPHFFEGVKNYIGYPKLTSEGKLVKIQIVAIDQQQSFQKEQWEFIGMWCGPQRALFVQRQGEIFPDEERPHYYKFRFKNQDEYRRYLWDRYAYQIIAKREGDELFIVRNNPFACPRRKPEPPMRGKPPFQSGVSSQDRPSVASNSSERPKPSGRPQLKTLPRSE